MIIHDANIVNQFYQEFHQRMNELENQVEPSTTVLVNLV